MSRSVLVERFRGSSRDSEAMVLGQLVHSLFQSLLVKAQRLQARARQPRVLERIVRREIKALCTSLKTLEAL